MINDDRTFYEERYDDSFMDSGAFIPTHSKRLGILATALILQIYSDETKPFTQNMLVGWLADFGIVCGRKTVGRNLSLLKGFGYPIRKGVGGYYMDSKRFTAEECKFVFQAVRSAPGKLEEEKEDICRRLLRSLTQLELIRREDI